MERKAEERGEGEGMGEGWWRRRCRREGREVGFRRAEGWVLGLKEMLRRER